MNKNETSRLSRRSAAWALQVSTILLLTAGCGGDTEIKTYRVAKEESQPHAALAQTHAEDAAPGERPQIPHIHSKVPEGWQEIQPERMRVASYRIAGADGKLASVSIIPLPGVSDIELRSVNMWRDELGLDPLGSDDQLKEQSQIVEVGDVKGILVDLGPSAVAGADKTSTRTIGTVAERKNITWFVKMTGDDGLVAAQKNAFIGFVKSLEFHEGSHDTQVAAAEKPVSTNVEKTPEKSNGPNFEVPANWTSKPPGPMVTSAYSIAGEGGQADVTISKFPGDVGGMVANIQRWRGQLGLPEQSAEEIRKAVEMLEIGGKKESYLVDLKGKNVRTGKDARMVAVGVPSQGETWFFKLMGDEALVAKEKDAFVRFVTSAY